MKLFHCKISFYRQGYPSSFREKHWQTKGGRKKEGWCMVLHQGHSSMYSVPSLLQGSTADWDTQAGQGRSSHNAYRTSPGPSTTFALLFPQHCGPLLASWELQTLALSRASPPGTNQHWSHSQCHKRTEITTNSEKLQSSTKPHSKAIAYSTMRESLQAES